MSSAKADAITAPRRLRLPRLRRRWLLLRSHYTRIAAVFLGLLLALGATEVLLFSSLWDSLALEMVQLEDWNLAYQLKERVQGELSLEEPDYYGLENEIQVWREQTRNPDVYVLDKSGRIIVAYANAIDFNAGTVPVEPLERFINRAPRDGPLMGSNPTDPKRPAVFSAAPIRISGKDGYLYVVLSTFLRERLNEVAKMSYIFRTGTIAVAAAFVGTALAGLVSFLLLSRRLRLLTETVVAFERGDFSKRIAVPEEGRRDELGTLGYAFNSMAEALVDSMEQLKQVDRLRRELVANLAHDLRTPLTAACGFLETLTESDQTVTDEVRRRYYGIMDANLHTVRQLLDDLFELSKLESGNMKLQLERHFLSKILERVVLKYEGLAEEKSSALNVSIPQDLPEVIVDATLLDRAISNILENSIKYSPPNSLIAFQCSATRDEFVIRISDNGPGIASQDLPHIFDRFFRGSRPLSHGGTGLGLAISQRIIEALNGKIEVSSALGEGTTFVICLPRA